MERVWKKELQRYEAVYQIAFHCVIVFYEQIQAEKFQRQGGAFPVKASELSRCVYDCKSTLFYLTLSTLLKSGKKTEALKEGIFSMLGCHNCPYDLKNYETYESSPCSSCRTRRNPPPISKFREDPATFNSLQTQHPAYEEDGEQEGMAAAAAAAGREESFHSLLISLAKTVRILVEMKEKYPETYKFVDAKMMDPTLSYSQLAERFSCRKQNVLYHLKKAVSIHPELSSALIVDTRFSRGIHALRTSPKLRKDQREGLGNEC